MGDAVLAHLRLPAARAGLRARRQRDARRHRRLDRESHGAQPTHRHPAVRQRGLAAPRDGGHRLLRSDQRSAHGAILVTLVTGRSAIPPTRVHELDAVVVGAGGAGLYAALELKQELGPEARIGVISKLYPSRSHTGAAQGGVCAALGNTEEDHWEWHWFDTVKGGDYLVDQDAAEVMCRDAIETIINLEHLGMPFDRTPERSEERRVGKELRY